MRFVLVGHVGFRNRGCEAIVRATSAMLREGFPGCAIDLVSYDGEHDRDHPAAAGVRVMNQWARRWSPQWFQYRARRALRQPVQPYDLVLPSVTSAVKEADAVLQIGGDNFTSDYGLREDSVLIRQNEVALAHGVPLVFWGASIGPFDSGDLEHMVLSHLRRAALITVRESISEKYLNEHAVTGNVVHVADPAMLLEPTPIDLSPFWPRAGRVLALNVSPLCCRYRSDGDIDFGRKVAEAVTREALRWEDWGVLLVPHVTAPHGGDDHAYMAPVLDSVGSPERVGLAPPDLDATQTKYVISRCRALIAARTHATIAGFSTGVPTISLAYSRKAYGINLDVFGHDEWLLDVVKMNDPREAVSLVQRLTGELDQVAAHLRQRGPALRQAAWAGVNALIEAVR